MNNLIVARAQGALLGQLVGDALGSQVEFLTAAQIQEEYPRGVQIMSGSAVHQTIPGQPTDDSEMALCLARTLLEQETYNPEATLKSYKFWLDSKPFSVGRTILSALQGVPNPQSEANGALMRISPLGIFGTFLPAAQVMEWAAQDAALTHINPVCQEVNSLYAATLAYIIRTGASGPDAFSYLEELSLSLPEHSEVRSWVLAATESQLPNYFEQMGWVKLAFHNALWQLREATSFQEGLLNTISLGGDTDTNAAIAGALLGSLFGVEAIPPSWRQTVLSCRPALGNPRVHRPRPQFFWPIDALDLANELVVVGSDLG